MVPVKDATAKTGITLKAVYRFRKMWNETHEVPKKKEVELKQRY